MEVYKGTLRLIRQTKKMVIYGDENLHAQYVPKAMLRQNGQKDYPDSILFTLTIPSASAKRNKD